uniref:Uncharacterized protein n=1 Tax=Anguilla anguilla TaxID=7936 RepID=A0A0E9PEF5_ANGAN
MYKIRRSFELNIGENGNGCLFLKRQVSLLVILPVAKGITLFQMKYLTQAC